MARKINRNIFLRFQNSLGLENSDGSSSTFNEGIQPVVDISPQVQDSFANSDSGSVGGIGTATMTYTCPDDRSINITHLSFKGSISNNTIIVSLGISGETHTAASSAGSSDWQFTNCDYWLNPGDTISCAVSTTYSGGITGYFDIYGLQYTGV